MHIGVISDTHGFLDPKIAEIFHGVEHILHAGDIGSTAIVAELRLIAPVTAVLGNNDGGLHFDLTEVLDLGGFKFLVHHIVDARRLPRPLEERISRERPDVVVCGHTHRVFAERLGRVLYFNPGYAGKPRFGLERSVAILECDGHGIAHRFVPLA